MTETMDLDRPSRAMDCESCKGMEDEDGDELMRCSRCRDRFYCVSALLQASDLKRHLSLPLDSAYIEPEMSKTRLEETQAQLYSLRDRGS